MSDANAVDAKGVFVKIPVESINPDVKLSLGKELSPSAPAYEDDASILSYIMMLYLNALLKWGAKNDLQIEDLGNTSNKDKSGKLYERFINHWKEETKKPLEKRSLWYVLWKTVGYFNVFMGISLYAGYAAISYGPVMILNRLVQHFQGTEILDDSIIALLVALMFILPVTGSVLYAHSNNIMAHMGIQFRNALTNAIYRKSLKLSPAAKQKQSTGMIVNMFSNDTAQLQRFLFFMNNCTIAPLQIAVCIGLIYEQVGVGAFVGLGLMIALIPVNGFIFTMLNDVRRKKVGFADVRVKLMNEILAGIRVIKFYAWEVAFSKKIKEQRNKELIELKKLAYIIAIGFTLIMFSLPIVQPILIFYTWVRLGNPLNAARAFTTIALFNLMQLPFAFLPLGLAQYSQSLVSTKRMMNFFSSEELDDYVTHEKDPDGTVVKFSNVSMSWILEETLEEEKKASEEAKGKVKSEAGGSYEMVNTNQTSEDKNDDDKKVPTINRSVHTLTDINLSIKQGQLVAIVGPVGCGKTSLISGLLGELHLKAGSINLFGSIAYCPQQAWILNQTLRDNVLFGLDYDEARFNRAIEVANLNADIAVLPAGVLTEIGERGINLSGGQKQRVSIARAVYRDADVYILDDPLSAVDSHVGSFIFKECIQGALAGKTRILVTNQTHLLSKCDLIIIMAEGGIKAIGTYESIQTQGLDLSAYIPKAIAHTVSSENLAAAVEDAAKKESQVVVAKNEVAVAEPDATAASEKGKKEKGKLMTIEEKNLGDVQFSAYIYYLRSGGFGWFFLVIIASLLSQVIGLLANFYLGYWCKISVSADLEGYSFSSERNLVYLNNFAWISMIGVFTITCRSLCLANHRLGTSTIFHEGLLHRTLGAPISFFDVTPLGRILNRFSSDMSVVDEELSQTISQVFNSFSQCLGAIGAVAGATKGTFLILIVPLMVFYTNIQGYFRKTNTVIARLEAISRSPIYSEFSQALTGVNSIRAYKDDKRFIDTLELRLDQNSVAGVTQQLAGQWLAIRLDILGALISFFIALITATSKGFIPAEFLALGLSYSFQLTTFLKFAVRMSATLEAQMNAVERIKFYIDEIEQEGTANELAEKDIPSNWPEKGVIKSNNICLRYREGPLVLKGITVEVYSGEKIGVVGRTGSGKSSLMNALYRIHELSDGSLLIDDIDISRVPLPLLRSKLGIVPQDPVMFSATVRFNLDPFNQHSDAEVWDALEMVEMKDHVTSLPNKLLEEVAEGGENFSSGQRQLICIGRALLRNPRILILDEATASIDNETDAMIQVTIRKVFQKCTVLTIAHRLHTIIDSDRVIVLDNGILAEFDKPDILLSKSDGIFKSLWDKHSATHNH